jgi:hypothetical protein
LEEFKFVESELEPREALSNAVVALVIIEDRSNIRKKGLVRDEICKSREKEGEEDKTLFGVTRTPPGQRVGTVGVNVTAGYSSCSNYCTTRP